MDRLLAGAEAKTAFGRGGSPDGPKGALAERALNAGMGHRPAGGGESNGRNGHGRKGVVTDTGRIASEAPRGRQASFDPQPTAKRQRRFPGFDDKVVPVSARGMGAREVAEHLRDLHGMEVSPGLASAAAGAVLDEVAAWRARPLGPLHLLAFLDALRVEIRDESSVQDEAAHTALGARAGGGKEIRGPWLEQNGGARFRMRVTTELESRGMEGGLLLTVVDGPKGFPEAILAVFPGAAVPTRVVHPLRRSPDSVSHKGREPAAAALEGTHRAVDAAAAEAEAAPAGFEAGPWGREHPAIGQSWRRAWGEVIPFHAFPVEPGPDRYAQAPRPGTR